MLPPAWGLKIEIRETNKMLEEKVIDLFMALRLTSEQANFSKVERFGTGRKAYATDRVPLVRVRRLKRLKRLQTLAMSPTYAGTRSEYPGRGPKVSHEGLQGGSEQGQVIQGRLPCEDTDHLGEGASHSLAQD